jgi:hypothetical protein
MAIYFDKNTLLCYPFQKWARRINKGLRGGVMSKVSLCGRIYCCRSIVLVAYLFLLTLSISMLIPTPLPAAEPSANAGTITDVQKAQIAADIASKKPLRLILRESRAAGINVKDTVTAMLTAGANPAAVVNAAGAEGYQTNEAVTAVLTFVKDKGADSKVVQSVISAAIAVGITQQTISTIATDVGYKPAQIANAIVVAQTAPTAPVFGYSAPPPISTFSSPALALTTSTPTAIGGAPVAVAGAGAGGAGGGGHGTVVGVTGSPVPTPVASPVRP